MRPALRGHSPRRRNAAGRNRGRDVSCDESKEALSKFTDSFADALRRRAPKKHAANECNRNRDGERHVTP